MREQKQTSRESLCTFQAVESNILPARWGKEGERDEGIRGRGPQTLLKMARNHPGRKEAGKQDGELLVDSGRRAAGYGLVGNLAVADRPGHRPSGPPCAQVPPQTGPDTQHTHTHTQHTTDKAGQPGHCSRFWLCSVAGGTLVSACLLAIGVDAPASPTLGKASFLLVQQALLRLLHLPPLGCQKLTKDEKTAACMCPAWSAWLANYLPACPTAIGSENVFFENTYQRPG